MKKLLLSGLLIVLGTPVVASASTINLTGTVRDFLYNGTPTGTYNGLSGTGHRDFENLLGDDHNIVTTTLGLDGKPVYTGASPTTHTAAEFNQWFNNTAGVNASAPFTITLDDTGHPGTFTYVNGNFFPIDGLLFGNQGAAHNYAFTYELHTVFNFQTGQEFTFTGDDDVFVYINQQKVIDLGGVHPSESATVSLNTLGLTPGTNYNLDVFFAERHTSASSFRIDTSIGSIQNPPTPSVPEPSSLLLLGMGLVGLTTARTFSRKS
jgi:fibro-slime domain-containing protein